ncbi:hypothetical protein ALI22I_32150 [Saccharothrix sp. ALI-22-I]|nr:hypothetical protein ALI22I_32150 [Saccharothrix sp. ALI-22-I]
MIGADPAQELRHKVMTRELVAPELALTEVLDVLRRRARLGHTGQRQADRAARWLPQAPVVTAGHRAYLDRAWALRGSVTTYDALYIALAGRLDVPLITCDKKLAGSNGHQVDIEVYPLP